MQLPRHFPNILFHACHRGSHEPKQQLCRPIKKFHSIYYSLLLSSQAQKFSFSLSLIHIPRISRPNYLRSKTTSTPEVPSLPLPNTSSPSFFQLASLQFPPYAAQTTLAATLHPPIQPKKRSPRPPSSLFSLRLYSASSIFLLSPLLPAVFRVLRIHSLTHPTYCQEPLALTALPRPTRVHSFSPFISELIK